MKFIIFILLISISFASFAGNSQKAFIHCDVSKIDGEGNAVASTTQKFCSRMIRNQHDKRYGEIKVNKNWTLLIDAEFPKVRWSLMSFEEKFLESNMYLKMGNRFDISAANEIKFSCYVDGNSCQNEVKKSDLSKISSSIQLNSVGAQAEGELFGNQVYLGHDQE